MSARLACALTMAAAGFTIAAGAQTLRSDPLPGAPVQISPENPPDNQAANLATLIKALRAENFVQREKASAALLRLRPEALSDIENALARETDQEAIARLTTIALHLYLKDPSRTPMHGLAGLLGISLQLEVAHEDGDAPRMAIVVMDTKPGFPAFEVLKADDRIIAIDNQPLPVDYTIESFRAKVSSKTPGSFLNVTVLRDGREFRTAVQVAGLEYGGDSLARFVEQREEIGRRYLHQLKTGLTQAPLVMKDDTPPNINVYNDYEIQDIP